MDEVKNSGDSLDQLAREAAEGAQFEFNPAAWTAMEQKLNAPKRGFFWWWFGGGLGLILLLLLLVGQPWQTSSRSDEESTAAIENSNEAEANQPKEKNVPQEKATTVTPIIENDSEEVENKNEKLTAENEASLRQQVQKDQNKNEELKETINPGIKKDTEPQNASKTFITSTASSNSSEDSQPIVSETGMGNQMTGLYEAGFEAIMPVWKPGVYIFDQSLKPMTLDSGFYQNVDPDSLQEFRRWTFGVMVSFDFSATGLDGFTDPGTMVGLIGEYRFSKNWGVQTGASYSIKKYRALGSEYETPQWIAARPDDLLAVEAKCIVIDIPINIRRYFSAKNGNDWFLSTGVSTYLMLREDYNYDYTEERPNWLPFWSISNQNNHFLGIANISGGYETSISDKLGLVVEPFMKLPLTGIGAGSVKFLSFGTNVAIKLR